MQRMTERERGREGDGDREERGANVKEAHMDRGGKT